MKTFLIPAIIAVLLYSSCKEKVQDQQSAFAGSHLIDTTIITADQQAKLTPEGILDSLKKGNKEYTEDQLVIRNTSARIRQASAGQYPSTVVLSCMDSRVPVEDIFHVGIGDMFVTRVAGNIVNEDILGSLEYGCKVSGAKVIIVLGHEHCGAITSAIKDVKLGNITALLSKITPAIKDLDNTYKGDKKYSNADYVEKVCEENVRLSISNIREKSPILKEMETKHEIIIVGGVYDMQTGVVTFLQ
jgi:carbonic anhydrase